MTNQFDVIVEIDSTGYFVASVPVLAGCHTQAKSLDELIERIREATELCLGVQGAAFEPLDKFLYGCYATALTGSAGRGNASPALCIK